MQTVYVGRTVVPEVFSFRSTPYILLRIQFRCIAGETHRCEPCTILFNKAHNYFRLMRRQRVPEEDELIAMILCLEILQQGQHLLLAHAPLQQPGECRCPFRFRIEYGHASCSEAFPASGALNEGRVPFESPGTDYMRSVRESRLVEEPKYHAVCEAPFLTSGQVVESHVLMASSFRSLARLIGF